MATNKILSDEDKLRFIRDGYIILRNTLTEEQVSAALAAIDERLDNGDYTYDESKFDPVPHFEKDLLRHDDIAGLLRHTDIFAAMEDLIGVDNVKCNRQAQVALRMKDKKFIEKGMGMTDLIPSFRYHIDGGDGPLATTGTPFTLLVGVCLSEGQHIDENRGQFTAWPGSHFKIHKVVRQRWSDGLIKGHMIFGGHGPHKPDIGTPIRVLLYPGDVVLVHQRLGHAGGINLHDNVRKNLYFRVAHKKHNEIVTDMLQGGVFTEYEGLNHMTEQIEQAEADAEERLGPVETNDSNE